MQRPAPKTLICTLCTSLALVTMPQLAQAELVGTEAIARAEGHLATGSAHARVAGTLARDEVAAGLRAQGVDPAQVMARVQALTDAEAQALAQQIETAPAGSGDVLGTIVFIFVLLLATDILGFTKVYPFTRSVR